jgi:hypothetical protein
VYTQHNQPSEQSRVQEREFKRERETRENIPTNGKTTGELETQGLSLGDGAQSTVGHTLSVQLDGALQK